MKTTKPKKPAPKKPAAKKGTKTTFKKPPVGFFTVERLSDNSFVVKSFMHVLNYPNYPLANASFRDAATLSKFIETL